VLEWPAAQVAELLGTTTTAVNSGLRRARAQLARVLPAEDELAEPAEPERQALLERFAAAVENGDAGALAELLAEDVALEMPPLLTWFVGRQAVVRFVAGSLLAGPGRLRLVPVLANGQPAFVVYQRDPGGAYHAHAVQVLTVTATGIVRILAFQNPCSGRSACHGCTVPPRPDPVAHLRGQAARLLGAYASADPDERPVAVGERELTASMVAVTGAIEITVHGWDISVACGTPRPVPLGLAAVLLPIAPLLITPAVRPGLFADPVRLPGPAGPGDQLVAFLGRHRARARQRRNQAPAPGQPAGSEPHRPTRGRGRDRRRRLSVGGARGATRVTAGSSGSATMSSTPRAY
jgi:uncharacterized protein (TIGR03086 family)